MSDDHRRADDDPEPEDRRWLDEPRNVTRLVYGLAALCALALLADLFYTKHPYFSVERWPAFFAVYGIVGSVTLVLTAKALRRLLRRDEDYYEPPEQDRYESAERDRDDD